ncbi:tyrosine-type recombinase/integrase [Roseomonas populi]|uniref:Integrase arm-type DNA-binding domain-containing protein n=1 Tax=Roseomonas populi TaxID=3121582 RepID=A0ABT1WXQ5_9PROT|nr:integrase arm-type DNA-binding domain-containing protein [Roseomonas pecuniae]MCR0980617.1 integrase arm-type DNA-binding domain-containing protein [Roseomonas pecuniae]
MPKLTERAVANAKPREKVYRLSDGDGLLLEVRPAGGRAWLFRFMLAGRRRDMGLGAYPAVGLKEARQKAKTAAAEVEKGIDPITHRDTAERAEAARKAERDERQARTFRGVAERLVEAQKPGWTSGKTLASWRLTLDKHAYPVIGDVPIGEITRDHVVEALTPVWTAQPATARKLQRRIASVLDYAAALGWRSTDNPATGRVLRLTKALPKQPPEQRQPSLPWQRVPAFLRVVEGMEGTAPLALRFAVLTAVRSAEVRHARWPELDFHTLTWTIPAQRMKGGKAKAMPPHRVPLTDAMLTVLAAAAVHVTGKIEGPDKLASQAALKGDALVFPSPSGLALSDAALGACIRRMNEDAPKGGPLPWQDVDGRGATPHGFRRSFRSWVDDTRPAEGEAAEKALAHEDENSVRAAYRGSDMLEQRRPLMAAWSEFCVPPAKGAEVVPIRGQR